jgi:hypothetical protein
MFGSVVLDIAVGLVLIYFLYSLLATIIYESIASLFGLRAIMLEKALWRMLVDNDPKLTNLSTKLIDGFKNHPLYKYMSSGGRIKRSPSFIADEDFPKIIIDCLKNMSDCEGVFSHVALSKTLTALKKPNGDNGIPSDTVALIESFLADANNDLEKFRALLESWYQKMMDRVSGWYKRQTQLFLFILGLVIAIGFNVDSIKIARTLSKDKDARAQMISIADTYAKNNKSFPVKDSLKADSLLSSAVQLVNNDISKTNAIVAIGWNSYNFPKHWTGWLLIALGWFLTSLAICLGAPFWFDILNKCMNLRGTGPKPGTAPNTEQDEVPLINRKG